MGPVLRSHRCHIQGVPKAEWSRLMLFFRRLNVNFGAKLISLDHCLFFSFFVVFFSPSKGWFLSFLIIFFFWWNFQKFWCHFSSTWLFGTYHAGFYTQRSIQTCRLGGDAMMAITPTKRSYISLDSDKKGNPAKNDDFNILVLWSFTEIQSWRDPGEAPLEFVLLCFAADSVAGGTRVLKVSGACDWKLPNSEHLPLLNPSKVQRSQAFVACHKKKKGFWMQNRNDSTWISWKEAIPIKFWDTTNWLTFRPRGWFFDLWTLDIRRSRTPASHSEVYDALQVLGLGCALKLDVHNRKIWKVWFFGQRPRWLVVEEIPICQIAGRSNCLGKSVGNLLARRTGCWFCQLLSFLEKYNKRPLTSRLSPAWGDTTLYWSQWLKKGGDSESIRLSVKKCHHVIFDTMQSVLFPVAFLP